MALPRLILGLPILAVLAAACNPYEYQRGEYNAGPVDATSFPPPYQGLGASTDVNGYQAGKGTFAEIRAYINGAPAGYYSFPFTATQLAANEPLLLPQRPVDASERVQPPPPRAYAFDPDWPRSPFPPSPTCNKPPNYTYDVRTVDMRLDEQSNIFTQLPFAMERLGQLPTWIYYPVVSETAVSAAGLACQSIKSEKKLKETLGERPSTGNYLLWAIIDPSSGVYRVGQRPLATLPDGGLDPASTSGVGVQKWGWFGQYYLAYIDGSYVPTEPTVRSAVTSCGGRACAAGQVCAGTPVSCQPCEAFGPLRCTDGFICGADRLCVGTRTKSQRIYIPRTRVRTSTTASPANPNIGQGYDVLQFRRTDPGHSPVCELWTYGAVDGALTSSLLKSETEILAIPESDPNAAMPGPRGNASTVPRYIYCPQVD